jgi:predicted transglutaminase-like cysteine proteinase
MIFVKQLQRPGKLIFLLGFFLLYSPLGFTSLITNQEINEIGAKHGEMAKRRLIAWNNLIKSKQGHSELEKLKSVNDFFNQFRFHSDISFIGESDYWMTPLEFIIKGGGDCEDFSIAKYFTLLALGIPMSKLRIMYVKALELDQAHMVLAYYESRSTEPLILDNLVSAIKLGSKRADLQPVYSFNGDGLWLNKLRGQSQRIGNSQNLSKWTLMLERMKKGIKP